MHPVLWLIGLAVVALVFFWIGGATTAIQFGLDGGPDFVVAFASAFLAIAIYWKLVPRKKLSSDAPLEKPVEKSAVKEKRPQPSPHKVFLSYRRADSQDVCGRIYEHLERELGQGVVFKDVDSLKLGVNFKDELARTLEHCKVALIVMGPNWIGAEDGSEARIASERDYVRIEAEAVLRRDIPVIPVFVRGAQTVDVSRLPDTLTELDERNGIQIRPDPDFKNDMNRLVSALQKILG